MNQALQTKSTASWLLAHREHLSLDKATTYLVGRVRARTPLGAAEYLDMMGGRIGDFEMLVSSGESGFSKHSREDRRTLFDIRVRLAVTKMGIYRHFFPREYADSDAPAYSLQREHELYQLIGSRFFAIDLDLLKGTRGGFLPMIPVQGAQQHDWENGCCGFDRLQTVFKLVLSLSDRVGSGWQRLGIDHQPAPPLDAPAWTFFVYSLAVEGGPLRHLVHAFNLTCYKTGNVWLDSSRDGYLPVEWSAANVAMLYMATLQALQINQQVKELNEWLEESPKQRIGRAVKLWNDASAATAREDGRRIYV